MPKCPRQHAGHTPGPYWRDDDGFIAAGNGESYVTIADCDCSDIDIDEREANKRLFIAAPLMLESLKKAHQFINTLLNATPDEAHDFLMNNGEAVEDMLFDASNAAEE